MTDRIDRALQIAFGVLFAGAIYAAIVLAIAAIDERRAPEPEHAASKAALLDCAPAKVAGRACVVCASADRPAVVTAIDCE